MYQVRANGNLLHDESLDDYRLSKATLDLELGKTGSFEFTIYPSHPNFSTIEPMKSVVTVSRNYQTIYSGRVLSIKYGFYGEKQVSCEGDLAFLLDSMIPPHSYSGDFSGYLEFILAKHNGLVEEEKRFIAGNVTVGDFSPYVTQQTVYKTAFDVLNSKMVKRSGGYLRVRYESGYKYLDLLDYNSDTSNISGQKIEVGKNLLNISRESNGEGVFSAIVPLGAKIGDTDTRLDIKSVNGGIPYIVNEVAVDACGGKIYRQVVFDNITDAQTLKNTAETWLANNYAGETTVELTVADLSGLDASLDSFSVGQWVSVLNLYHFPGIQLFQIRKMVIDLLNPAGNKIMIGAAKKGLTDDMAEISDTISNIEAPEAVQPYVIDSGETGIWTWRKYSDGTAECFGKINLSGVAVSAALGGWFRSETLFEAGAYPYPITFSEAPAVSMMFQTRNGSGALLWPFSASAENAKLYLPQAYIIRPTTATSISGNINIIAKGKA